MFSEITFETPIIKNVEYTFKIRSNLNWQQGQKTFIHHTDNIWWTGIFTAYDSSNGLCTIKCIDSTCSNTSGKYTGTLDLYTLRGPSGSRGPSASYYSDIIGSIDTPNVGDEIVLRPRKRQLSWQKGQRVFIYTDSLYWLYGNVLSYENDQLNILVVEKKQNSSQKLEKIYVDISGIRGIQGPPGPPCKWSAYGIASHIGTQTIKKNLKTQIKFDSILQDDLNLFQGTDSLILTENIHSISIKFLTTGFTEGVLFLSLELVQRPNNEIIPDIRYTFVKTILPQQPAVCEIFPPLKTFEKGDVYKIFAWFSGTDVDVDIKMMYLYYST
jgi:hypothetical protein